MSVIFCKCLVFQKKKIQIKTKEIVFFFLNLGPDNSLTLILQFFIMILKFLPFGNWIFQKCWYFVLNLWFVMSIRRYERQCSILI